MGLHGHGRGTDDLDVLVRPTPENAKRVDVLVIGHLLNTSELDYSSVVALV